jgi:ABC-type multidrug transport system fused ATPase/permease subunit
LRGEIVFQNVSFDYGDGKGVLRDVSFAIRPGQRVALVGASGAGKSTIASLLLRFYEPQAGEILIDGVEIRQYERESLRDQIGVVLQDSILFGASVRENIAYGKPHATDEEIEIAAREARAHEFILELPDGYETIIGERGSTLSGGQRQRLCLARALIKRPSIMLLDEPTSAIDAESSALIQQTVNSLFIDKTMLVISHQFAGIEDFDQILVLKNGQIVERGTHAQLVRQRGYYYSLLTYGSPSQAMA